MKVEITRYKSNTKEDKHRKGSIKKKEIRIDYHDTWDCAHTLSPIIAQMMKQLRETSHGYGAVKQEDVPVKLHSTYSGGFSKEAWDWTLTEIEWAMNEITTDKENEPEWFVFTNEDAENLKDLLEGSEIPGGKEANKAYHDRIQNGCRLFGTYLQTMWD